MIDGSLTKTKAAITTRISTGITVQMISIRVWPMICGPSTSRARPRLRKRMMKTTSAVSTITKIAAVKPRIR